MHVYVSLSTIYRTTSLPTPNTNKKIHCHLFCSILKVVPWSDIYGRQFSACSDTRTEQSYCISFWSLL